MSKKVLNVSLTAKVLGWGELRYLFHAPPNVKVRHMAFFCESGRRAVAHTRPAFPKNAHGPVGIPLIRGASGAGQSTPPKGVTAWGEGPLSP